MPKCHKIYPNCIWQVPSEWHTLGFYSALLAKVYWNYATHIVRVCVTPISSKTSKLDLTDKSNIQVCFCSKAMAGLYDLLCYHSLTSTDPLLEKLLAYLPTRFHSHIFDYIAYEHSSYNESVHSMDSSISAFYSDDSTYLFLNFFISFLFSMQLQDFYHHHRVQNIKKGNRPRTTDDPEEGPKTLQYPKTAGLGEQLQLFPPFLDSPGGEQSEPLPTVKACQLVVTSQIGPQLIEEDLT